MVKKEIPIIFTNERGKQLVGILHLPEKEFFTIRDAIRAEFAKK